MFNHSKRVFSGTILNSKKAFFTMRVNASSVYNKAIKIESLSMSNSSSNKLEIELKDGSSGIQGLRIAFDPSCANSCGYCPVFTLFLESNKYRLFREEWSPHV